MKYSRKTTLLVVALLISVLPLDRTKAQWKQTSGPGGGPITAIAQKGDTLYAGTNSGIYISLDTGFNWSFKGLTNDFVTFIFLKDNFLLAATSGNGIFRSNNGGTTWEHADAGLPAAIATSMISKGNYIFVSFNDTDPSNQSGVFRSNDNGTTWVRLLSNYLQYNALGVRGDTIYVAADDMYKSGDNGTTWTRLNMGTFFLSVNCFILLDSSIYAGVYPGGIYQSQDLGNTWNLSLYLTEAQVPTFATDGKIILAGTNFENYNGELYRSEDKGKTWTITPSFDGKAINVLFQKDSLWFVGTPAWGVYRSADEGKTWIDANRGFTNGIIQALTSFHGILFARTGIGVFQSNDLGVSWNSVHWGFSTQALGFINDQLVAASPQGIYLSSDDGKTWSLVNSQMVRVDNLASTQKSIFASVGTGPSDLYRSDDGGKSWTLRLSTTYGISSLFADDSTVLVGTEGFYWDLPAGTLHFSPNNGNDWVSSDAGNQVFSVARYHGYLYAAVEKGMNLFVNHTLRSSDGGFTWSPLGSDPQTPQVRSLWVAENSLFMGTRSGIFRISSDDSTFLPVDSGLVGSERDIYCISSSNGYLFIGTNGNGVWHRQISDISIVPEQISNNTPRSFLLAQNYPNPFNPTTTIRYQLPVRGFVTLKIYDRLGREITALVNQEQSAGTYSIKFDALGLSTGVYFYRIQAGGYTETKKLILLK